LDDINSENQLIEKHKANLIEKINNRDYTIELLEESKNHLLEEINTLVTFISK